MKKILKEPLIMFLLLGGVFFILFQQVSDGDYIDNSEIVITEGHVEAMAMNFKKVWQRFPTEKEINGLIERYVREEVLYREALAMGLDQEDAIIKRRLRQKIEFLSEDLTNLDNPEEQELEDYLKAHHAEYRTPTHYSFRQIYFNSKKRGKSVETAARTLLDTLQTREGNILEMGDSLMIKQRFENETEREIERSLGAEFLQALRETPKGSWQGPIKSGFGIHLVKITERIEGINPKLANVHDLVIRDWSSMKRKETNEAFYLNLRAQYTVKLETPASSDNFTPFLVTGASE